MTVPLRPILSTLSRHKTAAALIVIEIALTCAIVCNCVFLISARLERMATTTGMAEGELLALRVSEVSPTDDREAITRQDMAALKALPGVAGLTIANQLPFGPQSVISTVNLKPDQTNPSIVASTYAGDEHFAGTLGLRIVAGRDFRAEDIVDSKDTDGDVVNIPTVLVTRAMAERLFPGGALGQALYLFGSQPTRIIGVVDHFAATHPGGPRDPGFSMILPVRSTFHDGTYLLRTRPGAPADTLEAAVKAVDGVRNGRIVVLRASLLELRDRYYAGDRQMALLLAGVCAVLLVVTAFGIVGLASFWVQQRSRMIGVRRALGATQADIRRYFQAENALLSSIGIVLGMLGAYGINALLMVHYELPRLPALYLPVGALLLLLLGQLAVLAPARRASVLPPMSVMRAA